MQRESVGGPMSAAAPRSHSGLMAASSRPNATRPHQSFRRPPEPRRPDTAMIQPATMVQVRAQRRRHQVRRRFLSGD